jgi:hypothetical protein
MNTVRAILPLVAVAVIGASCSSTEAPSSGAPPLIVCGTTLSDVAAGALMTDATVPHASITRETGGNVVILKVSPGCEHGGSYVIDPPTAASLSKTAPADDHKVAAVVLSPKIASFDVRVTHPDGSTGIVEVRLGENFYFIDRSPTATH